MGGEALRPSLGSRPRHPRDAGARRRRHAAGADREGGGVRRAAAIVVLGVALGPSGCRDRRGPAPTPRASAASGNGHNVLLVTIDTLRADHLGAYGYKRPTSPRIDALGRAGTVFESAYTAWPKTRGSMVIMLQGRNTSRNG